MSKYKSISYPGVQKEAQHLTYQFALSLTASGRQLLVLVQWMGLLVEDTSWEKWESLKIHYNLEDKVVLEAWRNVMNENAEQDTNVE